MAKLPLSSCYLLLHQLNLFLTKKCWNSRRQLKSFTEMLRSCRVEEDEKCNVISLLEQVGLFDCFMESSLNLSKTLSQIKVSHPLLASFDSPRICSCLTFESSIKIMLCIKHLRLVQQTLNHNDLFRAHVP